MGNQTAPKSKLRKGLWSPEEDEKLVRYITKYGHKCWSIVPKQAGLQRCGKSCRLRWINYLRPDLKRGHFTQEEEDLIVKLHAMLGNRWAQIATQLPGRTDNEIKNFWNSCLRKKLRQVGIDPQTHKPLHIPAKLDTSTTKFAGEVLQKDEEDLKPNISKNPWQFQAAPVETSKETFTMSMLPVTVSPYARNLPIMGYTDLGSFNFKMEESPTYTSNVTNNSNSVSFSPLEEQQQASSTETVCSETIDTFPFWEVCSGESVSEKVRGSGDSWEFCDPLFKWSVVNSSILDHNKDDITWQHRSLAEFYDDESAVSDPIFDNM